MAITPLYPINPTDPMIRETYYAKWGERPSLERRKYYREIPILPFTKAYQIFRSLAQIPLRPLVYYASSEQFKQTKDEVRLERSREHLRSIGGQTVLLMPEGGDWIEAMYFDVDHFRQAIVQQGGQFLVNSEGEYVLRVYEDALGDLLRDAFWLRGKCKYSADIEEYFSEFLLPAYGKGMPRTTETRQALILTQGNACIFEMNREPIISSLLSGQSCIVFNLEGTGRSHGNPDEQRSYADIEAVCQFLHSKGFTDSQITVKGYCLGSGMAVDLASRRPVHLILDRSFAKIGDITVATAKRLAFQYLNLSEKDQGFTTSALNSVVETVVPFAVNWGVISYDNSSKIQKVRGSICYIHSNRDEVIPEKSRENLRRAVEKMPRSTVHSSNDFKHNDDWDWETKHRFFTHLSDWRLIREHAPTPFLFRIALLGAVREQRRKERARASKIALGITAAASGAAISAGPALGVAAAVGTSVF